VEIEALTQRTFEWQAGTRQPLPAVVESSTGTPSPITAAHHEEFDLTPKVVVAIFEPSVEPTQLKAEWRRI
jgi:hypothetical protein